jgi:hypothetical protein
MSENNNDHATGYNSSKPSYMFPTGSNARIGAINREQEEARKKREAEEQKKKKQKPGSWW